MIGKLAAACMLAMAIAATTATETNANQKAPPQATKHEQTGGGGDNDPPSTGEDPDSLYDGYYWIDGNWVPGLITIDTWYTPTPQYSRGGAVFYGPNVMEGTARWRGLPLDGYLDGVAMMSPADIGATVWLRRPDQAWEGPYLVVDTAARQDMYPVITHRKEVVEVGFRTAARWGMVVEGRSGWKTRDWIIENVEIVKSEQLPEWANPDWQGWTPEPVDYPVWYAKIAEFSTRWEPHPYYVRPGRWNMRDGSEPKGWRDFDMRSTEFVPNYRIVFDILLGGRNAGFYVID